MGESEAEAGAVTGCVKRELPLQVGELHLGRAPATRRPRGQHCGGPNRHPAGNRRGERRTAQLAPVRVTSIGRRIERNETPHVDQTTPVYDRHRGSHRYYGGKRERSRYGTCLVHRRKTNEARDEEARSK